MPAKSVTERVYGVRRTVVLNPIEPSLLSLRVPPGVDVALTIQTLLQDESTPIYPFDGWIELRARTDGSINRIDLTDNTSGLLSVTLPGGDLSDRNGYSISLIGPLSDGGDPQLIAAGTLVLMQPLMPPAGRPLVETP